VSEIEGLRLHSLLYDGITELNTLAHNLYTVRELWERGNGCAILGFVLLDAPQLEGRMGWQEFDRTLLVIAENLKACAEAIPRSVLCVNRVRGDEFYLFLPADADPGAARDEILALLGSRGVDLSFLSCGAGTFRGREGVRWERLLYRAVEEVRDGAVLQGRKKEEALTAYLEGLAAKPVFSLHYQPIVRLRDRSLVGVECLFRLPMGAPFVGNELFFAFAEKTPYITSIEERIWDKAHAELGPGAEILFFNVTPLTLLESDRFFENGIRSAVLEITERVKIPDWARFRRRVEELKGAGQRIAIDDVGAGYSSLQAVLEIQPHFIKIDYSLIHGLENHPIKRGLIASLVEAAGHMDAQVIAECIETDRELEALLELGVDLGQGHALQPPLPRSELRF
jgi:EAL domain-containing protein (putative c-di-GMP-specific phosphodiesterase class I)